MLRSFSKPLDPAILHRRFGIETLGNGVRNDGLTLLLQQLDQFLLLGHHRIDFGGLAVEEGKYQLHLIGVW